MSKVINWTKVTSNMTHSEETKPVALTVVDLCVSEVGMPRHRNFYLTCHRGLCHDMSYVMT